MITYCDVNTCEDCPRYGDDCDGDKRVEHTDLISRADAIDAVASITMSIHLSEVICDKLLALPSADAVHGEWVEKEVMVDEDTNITEWQSARCSVCGKYHTTPYMYYFDNFNFCPNCGAKMDGERREL